MKAQNELIECLEKDLGLPRGFCFRLMEEDDWSFVIKLHALFECGTADLLTKTFGRAELDSIFSKLPLGEKTFGKLKFIAALRLIPVGHIKFIEELGKIRNALAHKIGNVGFTLVDHFEREKAKRKKQFAEHADLWAFGMYVSDQDSQREPLARTLMRLETTQCTLADGSKIDRSLLLLGQPKVTILWSALAILEAISLCNLCGPQMWDFLMKCEDRKGYEDWVHELFARAKVGDPTLPEKTAQKFERMVSGVRVERDKDGQPVLESLAAAFYAWSRSPQVLAERLKED